MFTGIVSNLGKLTDKQDSTATFSAERAFCSKVTQGTSVSVNGVCLTVAKQADQSFSVEVMPETLNKTVLGNLKIGDPVNLELPLTPQSFLSGHIVQGHIDGTASLISITEQGNSHLLKFSISGNLSKYMAEKGSVTVNGISLTIIESAEDFFTVGIIPFTWENTMLHTMQIDDKVNVEVDILAKYLERLTSK